MPDTVEQIMLFESGGLDTEGILNLFSKLIKNGQAWTCLLYTSDAADE